MSSEVILGLSREMGKSPLQVIFDPCIKAVLGVSQWYWWVVQGVLGCFGVNNWCYGRFGVLFEADTWQK